MNFKRTVEFARQLDLEDPLNSYREKFHIPKFNDKNVIYFCGNSLGLQPKIAKYFIEQELNAWKEFGVRGHFEGKNPWFSYHKLLKKMLAHIVGGTELEVTAMNSLTANLHFMMVSFYTPTKKKYKILTEAGAFPSDQYALESQARFHGFDPADAIIEVKPRIGEQTLRNEDVIKAIEENSKDLALVLFCGVQYVTGQYFDIKAITEAGKKAGANVGFDLAHAIGNVPLNLHDWGPDFAVWCSYKYLNAGPGSTGGIFVHERHSFNENLPRFGGWWGHNEDERFMMEKGFKPIPGADGWQLSNSNIFSKALLRASLSIFEDVGMEPLRTKSVSLTSFLEFLIKNNPKIKETVEIITPSNSEERGCQLSLMIHKKGKELLEKFTDAGAIIDWREPNVIRVAPTPLYNTYEEVYEFSEILESVVS